MESSLRNMVLTLFVITFLASAAVGLVYKATVNPIELAKAAKVSKAIGLVLPVFDNDPGQTKLVAEVDGQPMTLYIASMEDKVVGYAVETFTTKGFGGVIRLMVGFLPDGSIHKIEVLQQNETPGLGDKIESTKSNFSVQFEGENPADFKLAVTKDGGNVDAITASTVSSRAYVDAVQRAYTFFQNRDKLEVSHE